MKLRTMISSLAVISAMTFSGGAFAQMIGGVQVPAEQWPSFEQKCQALTVAATETLATPNNESDDATATGSVVANGEDDPEHSNSDPASSENIDQLLAGLTPEQCAEAGLGAGVSSGADK